MPVLARKFKPMPSTTAPLDNCVMLPVVEVKDTFPLAFEMLPPKRMSPTLLTLSAPVS